jgi:hypothetical protein
MHPSYPIYIVSKGRYGNALTPKALTQMGVTYKLIVEAFEFELYKSKYPEAEILILPEHYLDAYDTFDKLGESKSRGPGAARNFAKAHSIESGHAYHWVMDDNLHDFHRLHQNDKRPLRCGNGFKAMEDFVERFDNVIIAGPNYYSFCKANTTLPPFVANTRIYSCLLIRNDIKYDWRGRYNEDTDLSLRVLKDGLCTIQFNAFLCGKVTTQRMSGGNTKEFYDTEGTKAKSQMLEDMHPDVAKVVWKFNRWHHQVDYRPFRKNKLIKRQGVVIPQGINNYGMSLQVESA